MNTFRNVLLGTAAAGLTAMAISPANAAGTTKTFKVSGWVNRVMVVTDDGNNSYVDFADNVLSGSRFRMIGESKGGGLAVGARLEFGLTRNQSVDQASGGSNATANGLLQRNAFVYFKSAKYGTLALGLQSTATDGTAEIDLSGTGAASYNTNVFPDRKYYFLQSNQKGGTTAGSTAAGAANPRVDSVFNGFDGNSRQDAIRYTTPSFKGFKIDVSSSQGGTAESALKYSGKFYNTKVAAAFGYTDRASTSSSNNGSYVGTISALHASGLNATFSYAKRDLVSTTNKDPVNIYGKIGYQLKVFGAGRTAVSVSYQKTSNLAVSGDRAHKWGVEAVQKLDNYSTELIAAFTKQELKRTGTSYQAINAGWVGARVKF
jgi:hypothetical protein